MAKICLITGGAYTGKARWASTYFNGCDDVLYICPGSSIAYDISNRISYSNNENLVDWDIRTDVRNPVELIKDHKYYILDNLSTYTAVVFDEMCPDINAYDLKLRKKIEKKLVDDILEIIDIINNSEESSIVIITDETGFCPVPCDKKQQYIQEILGMVNQRTANIVPEVYLSISGIQMKIKG